MKRFVFIFILVGMLLGVCFVSFASGEESYSTNVEYVADGEMEYEVTVPSTMEPGSSGEISLVGIWPSIYAINVTADPEVVLVNSFNSNEKRTLGVNFEGIKLIGSNEEVRNIEAEINIDEMPDDILFGIWKGKFNYQIEVLDEVTFKCNAVYFTAGIGMTFEDFINSDYNNGLDVNGDEYSQFVIVNEGSDDAYVALDGVSSLWYTDNGTQKVLTPDVVITEGFHCYFVV